jgi:hypothetical protein
VYFSAAASALLASGFRCQCGAQPNVSAEDQGAEPPAQDGEPGDDRRASPG